MSFVRMFVGNVKTFANPKLINTTRHFASARKLFLYVYKFSFSLSLQYRAMSLSAAESRSVISID